MVTECKTPKCTTTTGVITSGGTTHGGTTYSGTTYGGITIPADTTYGDHDQVRKILLNKYKYHALILNIPRK